jgi:hypothetical protein
LEGIKGFINSPVCDKTLLLGLQFADPTEQEVGIVTDISRKVNEAHWHNKVLALNNEQVSS